MPKLSKFDPKNQHQQKQSFFIKVKLKN